MGENVTIDMLKPSITFGNKKIGNMWSFSLPSYIKNCQENPVRLRRG